MHSEETFDRTHLLEAVFQQRTRFSGREKVLETPWCASLFKAQELIQHGINNAACNGTVIRGETEYEIADGTIRYATCDRASAH
ncbi:MAG: hypothetical protein KME10_10940 [Plectolyngbya sp. WJT66-NPBG17]|jgi:hypothetical protein|nr:hypothetical protein [Plectolyngbya sp. WJT66-NPBG17]